MHLSVCKRVGTEPHFTINAVHRAESNFVLKFDAVPYMNTSFNRESGMHGRALGFSTAKRSNS